MNWTINSIRMQEKTTENKCKRISPHDQLNIILKSTDKAYT